MCGIVGIVSRPPTRPVPSPAEVLAGLDAALGRARRRRRRRGVPAARSTRCCTACPGVLALVDHHELVAGDHRPPRPARRLRRRDRRRARPPATLDADALERRSAELDRAARRAVGDPPRPPAHGRAPSPTSPGATPARPRSPATSPIQQALSAIDRMEVRGRDSAGHPRLRLGPRPRRRRPGRRGRRRRARRRPAVPDRRRPAFAGALPVVRLQGGGRDRRARRQHPGDARRRRRRPAPAPRAAQRAGPGRRARAHPLGQRRHHLRAQRPPGQQRRDRAAGRRRCRRSSSACSTATSTTTPTCKVEHGLRFAGPITTDAKVIPALVARHAARRRRPGRGVPPHGRRVRGLGGHRRRRRRRARAAVPRPQRQRPGRLRRPRRRPLHRRQRALRRRRGDRRATSASTASTAARSSRSTPRAAGTLEGIDASRLRRHARCRSTAADVVDGRGDHPRHRPRRRPALPAQGDHRVARQPRARRCAARSSSATGCCTPSSAPRALPPTSPTGSPTARSRGIRVIGQGTAAVAGQSMANVLDELAGGALDVDADHGHRAVRASGCGST